MTESTINRNLRERAKKRILNSQADPKKMSRQDINSLVEELQIHQIELEIQNEELREAQVILEANRNRYISLFNNAPNGYVVLDDAGIIREYNLTFGEMLGSPVISGTAFADLLTGSDGQVFRARYDALFKHPEQKSTEYRLTRATGGKRHIQIKARSHTKDFYASGSSAKELLLMISDVTELTHTKHQAESALAEAMSREAEISALLDGAKSVLEPDSFENQARNLFDICARTIGAVSGYVALLSKNGEENQVLFLESGGLPCTVDPNLPMPVRGLREVAYRTRQAVFENDFTHSQWEAFMPQGHVRLENVLFTPLVSLGKTVGVMGLANKPAPFTETDARIALGFGKLCAIALQNSRNLDRREAAEKKNRRLIAELREALANVKQLSGLLPICSHCKKIRDDKGYWEHVESYLSEHTDATFSHGICRECAVKHYPGLDLYDN